MPCDRIATAGGTPTIARAPTGEGAGVAPPVSLHPGATARRRAAPRFTRGAAAADQYWE